MLLFAEIINLMNVEWCYLKVFKIDPSAMYGVRMLMCICRLRLTCQCDSSQTSLVQSKCGQFLPYNQQH